MCMCVYIYVYLYVYIYRNIHMCTVYRYVYIYICRKMCVYIYICISIDTFLKALQYRLSSREGHRDHGPCFLVRKFKLCGVGGFRS